jgi:ribosome maturation factor RimP
MKDRKPSGPIAEMAGEIVEGMGFAMLEFSAEQIKRRTHVHCVLYHPDGVGVDALGEVHRALQPRLEEMLGDRALHIEFSSPGINRQLKSFHEFAAFIGREVHLLPTTSDDWLEGVVEAATPQHVTIALPANETAHYTADEIRKARLGD